MATLRERLKTLSHSHADGCHHLRVPAEHVRYVSAQAAGHGGPPAVQNVHCFTVTVNGMRLEFDRVWGKTYDPMVLAVSEFLYNGKSRRAPFVVGSSMVVADHGTPHGMQFTDTLVAGPLPYNGQLAITLILYRVLRDDYVRAALGAVQQICSAVGVAGPVSTALDIGEGVLDAVDAALGHQQVEPLLAHRVEFTGEKLPPASFALVPDPIPETQLWLDRGVLLKGGAANTVSPLDKTSYIVYSLGVAPPTDLSALPWFTPLWNRIVQWANIPNDSAKDVTKNYLAALYEEIATSPDVPRDAVDDVYAGYEKKAMAVHAAAQRRQAWGPGELRDDPVRARVLAIRESS